MRGISSKNRAGVLGRTGVQVRSTIGGGSCEERRRRRAAADPAVRIP